MKDTETLRKLLHQNPELSGKEYATSERIQDFLSRVPPDEMFTNIGGTGILAIYHPQQEVQQTVLFRCELDALPIQEINDFEHRSNTINISHKCGHDGHMAIMCELAKKIYEKKAINTKVVLLFQPAEENGEGAIAVYNDERFKSLQIDKVFALHNLPEFPMHEIVVKDHTFTCAVNSIIIQLFGKTSHAGEPEKGDNPALCIASVIGQFNQLMQPDPNKEKYTILTPVYIHMGSKDYGISAGYGEVHYTFRRAANNEMKELEKELQDIAQSTAKKYNLEPKISWTQRFSANENNPQEVDIVRRSAEQLQLSLTEKQSPLQWGEDFGVFTEHFDGAMFGLGSGENTPALHNPDYDFPDELIETGAQIFYQIISNIDAQ